MNEFIYVLITNNYINTTISERLTHFAVSLHEPEHGWCFGIFIGSKAHIVHFYTNMYYQK